METYNIISEIPHEGPGVGGGVVMLVLLFQIYH